MKKIEYLKENYWGIVYFLVLSLVNIIMFLGVFNFMELNFILYLGVGCCIGSNIILNYSMYSNLKDNYIKDNFFKEGGEAQYF